MSTQYQLRIYNRTGTLQHIITDMRNLSYVREVNTPGLLMFELSAHHRAIVDFELDGQVEVWRSNFERGIDWYCDFYGLWRGEERETDSNGSGIYRAICTGQMDLLSRPIVAYPAGTANRSLFTAQKAETIAKNLVAYNATNMGTVADGRKRDVTLTGITVETDGGRGNTLDVACAWRKLLEVLQDVSATGGGDFDLEKNGPASWQFRWYPNQLGTDRSAPVVLALEYGNIADPKLVRSYANDKTVAIVGGQGQDASRTVIVRTGASYLAGCNDREFFVDSRTTSSTAGLENIGDTELINQRARYELTFEVLQVPQTLYGRDYFLGDLVTARYETVIAVRKIQRVSIGMQADGTEQIQVDLKGT